MVVPDSGGEFCHVRDRNTRSAVSGTAVSPHRPRGRPRTGPPHPPAALPRPPGWWRPGARPCRADTVARPASAFRQAGVPPSICIPSSRFPRRSAPRWPPGAGAAVSGRATAGQHSV